MSREFNVNDECLKLVKEKGVYLYQYMDSFNKFNECELPNKDTFFSSLNGVGISDEDYSRAKNVWNAFNVKNLGEYYDICEMYLESLLMFV